jgi:hypothetical protein
MHNMDPRKQHWQRTEVLYLSKLTNFGTYYVRVKIAKKPYQQSPETTNLKVAKHRYVIGSWSISFPRRNTVKLGFMTVLWIYIRPNESPRGQSLRM